MAMTRRKTEYTNINHIKIDESELYRIYQNWPQHFTAAQSISSKTDRESSYYNSVIICGMGGSGTVCDVLNELLERFGTIQSMSLRGKILPSYINKHTQVIINNVSGDTLEALLSMKQAVKKKSYHMLERSMLSLNRIMSFFTTLFSHFSVCPFIYSHALQSMVRYE